MAKLILVQNRKFLLIMKYISHFISLYHLSFVHFGRHIFTSAPIFNTLYYGHKDNTLDCCTLPYGTSGLHIAFHQCIAKVVSILIFYDTFKST